MKAVTLGVISLLAVVTGTVTHAQIYQWVDSKGKVTYSDKPQSDKPASIKSITKQPASKDTSYREQLQKQQRLLDSYSQRRAENKRRLTSSTGSSNNSRINLINDAQSTRDTWIQAAGYIKQTPMVNEYL